MNKEYNLAVSICKIIQDEGHQAYFAGGCVRDIISSDSYNDIDIATSASPDFIISLMKKNGFIVKEVGKSFGVVLAKKDNFEFEIATFRIDRNCDGRHPGSVEYTTAEEDAKRRDFTINSVFYDPIKYAIVDFTGGQKDIRNKTLKFVGNLEERIQEDYLRVLRFVRFWLKGFTPSSLDIIRVNGLCENYNKFVSPERTHKELTEKILGKFPVVDVFNKLIQLPNLFKAIFPEIYNTIGCSQNPKFHPEGDVFTHTMLLSKYIDSKDYRLILAGLLHDVGKPSTSILEDGRITSKGHEKVSTDMTVEFLTRLRFSNDDIEYISSLVKDHMLLHNEGLSLSSLKKIKTKPYFNDLVKLTFADCMASTKDTFVLDAYIEKFEGIKIEVLPEPFVSGKTLISLGLKPSPVFALLLKEMMELQLEEKINSEEEGIKYFKDKYLKDMPKILPTA